MKKLSRGGDKNTERLLRTASQWRMVRLTGQIRQKIKSHRQIGRESSSSYPDDIWVSETLFLRGVHAKIAPCTLTGPESHNLVTAQTKLHRRLAARHRAGTGIVRHSVSCLRTIEGRDKFHQAVIPRLPSKEAIQSMSSEEIVSSVFEQPQKLTFGEQEETYIDPGPLGFVTNAETSLRKHQPMLEAAHRAFWESGTVKRSDEHERYKKAVKKRDGLARTIKVSEGRFLHRQLERCRQTGDYKRVHKAIRDKRKGKTDARDVSCLVYDARNIQTSSIAISCIMTQYVSTLYYGRGPLTRTALTFDYSALPPYHPLSDQPASTEETACALSRLKPRKAVGLDGIHAEMFIGATPEEIESFTEAFEQILGNEFLPSGK